MVYLDNAATSWPKPESVYQTMDQFLRRCGGNPGRGGHSLALAAAEKVEETRLLIARLINAPEKERVVFTSNCTEALNLGLKGLLKPGDHVITDCIGHNSLVRPLKKLENQGVRVTRILPCFEGFLSPEEMKKAIIPETRLIVVTHASNVTGLIQPIDKYGAIAKKHGLIFMVDAAQTAGMYPIDVQANNIDLLASSGHKGLFGPPGTGVLYLSERVDLEPLREGGTGIYSELEDQPQTLPYKYESGTLNTVGIAGLGAGIKFLFQEGREKIQSKVHFLREHLNKGLAQIPGVILYCQSEGSLKKGAVVSFNLKGWEPAEVGVVLDQTFEIKGRTGLHCAPVAHKTLGTYPQGTIRISPGYFNTLEEVNFTLEAVSKIAGAKAF
jgi:cysteine desulfurase family protein